MPLAFGGILFFLAAIMLLAVIVWATFGYTRATTKAGEEGIDPETDDRDDGHVAGPQGR